VHTVIQVPPDGVMGPRDCCCHSFAACIVDVTVCFIRRTVSALTSGLSRYSAHPADCILPILVRKLAVGVFPATVNGHEATEKANRIQAWQGLSDWQLDDRFVKDRPVLLLPVSWWSEQHEPDSRVQDGGKSRHAERSASNVQSAGSSRSLVRTFTRRNWVEVAGA